MAVVTLASPVAMDLSVCESVIVVEIPECATLISEVGIVYTKLPCFSDMGLCLSRIGMAVKPL
jgi:hypothetical protein